MRFRQLDCIRFAVPRATTIVGAAGFIPAGAGLSEMRRAVQACRGCDLYKFATRAVFGEGHTHSRIAMVGEQPGDEEDKLGHPFVGPAGRILDRALEEAGIDRSLVYLSNAVKHFKFEERGKRRIHKRPLESEIVVCRPWLETELALIRPEVIVCLGATATRSILGKNYHLTAERGKFVAHPWAPHVIATVHPSAVLRLPDREQRHLMYAALVADFRKVKEMLKK